MTSCSGYKEQSASFSLCFACSKDIGFKPLFKQAVLIWQHMLTTGKRDQADSCTLKISDLTKLPYTDKLQQFLICYNIDSNKSQPKNSKAWWCQLLVSCRSNCSCNRSKNVVVFQNRLKMLMSRLHTGWLKGMTLKDKYKRHILDFWRANLFLLVQPSLSFLVAQRMWNHHCIWCSGRDD